MSEHSDEFGVLGELHVNFLSHECFEGTHVSKVEIHVDSGYWDVDVLEDVLDHPLISLLHFSYIRVFENLDSGRVELDVLFLDA